MKQRITSSPEDYLKEVKAMKFYPFVDDENYTENETLTDIDTRLEKLSKKIVEASAFCDAVNLSAFPAEKFRQMERANGIVLNAVYRDADSIYLDLACEYGALLLRREELRG